MAILDELVGILGFDFQGRNEAQRYQQTLGKVDKQLDGVSQRAVKFGRLITGAIAALGTARVIGSAVSFEESMADINKVVDATPEQISSLGDEFLKMSRGLPISAEGLAAIAAEAGAAGVAFDDLDAFARQVAIAVTAFDLPAEQVGETMSKLANVFGFNVEEIGHFSDTVNHLSNNMAAKAGELLDFTNRAAGAATLLGLTADQLAGVGAAMIAAGVIPQTAARGLNAFATRVQTDATGVNDALQLIGLTTTELQEKLAADGDAALVEVFRELAELDVSKQAGALKALVGQDFSDDFSKFLANPDLLAQGFELANDEVGKLGSAQNEFDARAATTRAKWDRIKNILTSVGIILAGPLLDGFKRVADFVFKMVQAFDGAGGAAAGLAAALGAIGLNVDPAQIEAFAEQVRAALGVVAENVRMVADLWVQRVKDFTQTAAFEKLIGYFQEVGAGVQQLWSAIQDTIGSEGGQELIRVLDEIGKALFFLLVTVIGENIAAAARLLLNGFTTIVKAFGLLLNGDFMGALQRIFEGVGDAINIVTDRISGVTTALVDFMKSVLDAFGMDVARGIFDNIVDGVERAMNFAVGKINSLITLINSRLGRIGVEIGTVKEFDIDGSDNLPVGGALPNFDPVAFDEQLTDAEFQQGLTELSNMLQSNLTPAANELAAAATAVQSVEATAPGLIEQTLNTDNTRNIKNDVTNNIVVNQTVTGPTAAGAAAGAVEAGVDRGMDRALTVNNSGADS